MSDFGFYLRTLRKSRRGWTQERLAQESGLSRNYIADIESGRSANPSRAALRGLARALGVTPSELIELEPPGADGPAPIPEPEPSIALLRFVSSEPYERKVERIAASTGLDVDEADRRVREVLRLLPQPPSGLTGADYHAVMLFLNALADS